MPKKIAARLYVSGPKDALKWAIAPFLEDAADTLGPDTRVPDPDELRHRGRPGEGVEHQLVLRAARHLGVDLARRPRSDQETSASVEQHTHGDVHGFALRHRPGELRGELRSGIGQNLKPFQ